MTDQQIAPGSGATPVAITVQGSEQLMPKLAFAEYDGTGAAGDFVPVLTFIGPGGQLAGQAVGDVVTAGASVDQTWFRGLSKASGQSSPTASEQIGSSVVTTIAAGNSGFLNWDTKLGGSTLLNLTNPQLPTFVKAGVYAVTVTAFPSALPAGAVYRLEVSPGLPLANTPFVAQTSGPAVAAPGNFPEVAATIVHFFHAGEHVTAIVNNYDTVQHDYGIEIANVQQIS